MSWLRFASLLLLALLTTAASAQGQQAAIESLLAADRAFAAAAANAADPLAGLAPMLDAGDPARRERKYLSYWVRRAEGWRVVAYRQGPGAPGAAGVAMLPASLPGCILPGDDAAHRNSLAAAEQAFSDRAQQIGLRAAFREYGRDDAMNMGGPGPFAIGAEAISLAVGPAEATSPVRWSTERSVVAASGDLGVSIGTIHANGAVPEGQPASFPFFTVWRRDGADAPWRYVAE